MNSFGNKPLPSERLIYRRMVRADAAFVLELLNSPGWLQYIGDRKVYDLDAAERYLQERIFPNCSTAMYGPYLIELRDTGEPIGLVGIYARLGLPLPDLGFAFLDPYQQRGFGWEAARTLLRFASELHANSPVESGTALCAITTADNVKSQRLLARLGFRQNGTLLLPDDVKPYDYWINSMALDLAAAESL